MLSCGAAELYFIDVGQGDAAFIVTPQGRTILVDGGRGDEAFQFLVWRYRLDLPAALPVDVDLLVLTHTDEDHIDGLAKIIAHPLIRVRRIVQSGIAKFRPGVFDTELGRTVDGPGASQVLLTSYGHPRANFMAATGRASRSDEPLLFSTELVAQFSPDPQTTPLGTPEPVDPSNAALLTNARQRLFAARRVNAAFQFETYGPSPAAP